MGEIKVKFYSDELKKFCTVQSVSFAGSGEPCSVCVDVNGALHNFYMTEGDLVVYTGLKDKYAEANIYNGDILKNDVSGKLHQVIFCEGSYYITKLAKSVKPRAKRVQLSGKTILDKWLVKVGSRYENPELLESSNDKQHR